VTKHITVSLPLKASVLITAARPRLKEEIQGLKEISSNLQFKFHRKEDQ
jgi:hypothetical protein